MLLPRPHEGGAYARVGVWLLTTIRSDATDADMGQRLEAGLMPAKSCSRAVRMAAAGQACGLSGQP